MTQFLPPNLLALFAPRDAIPYKPPYGQLTWEKDRLRSPYTGIGHLVPLFEDLKDTPPPTRGETKAEKKRRRIREKGEKRLVEIQDEVAAWDPHNDPNANSDAFKTLFVSRINYDTSESKLRREFESYGKIKKIHMVTNVATGKSRGYAFIEFDRERDMHAAYKSADGKKIDGRRVLVDVERGRTVKGWRPRRLGGGLGSTRVTVEDGGERPMDRERNNSRSATRELDRGSERPRDRGPARGGDRGDRDRDRDRRERRDRSDRGDRDRGDRDRGDRDRDRADRDRGDRDRADRDRSDRDRGDRDRGDRDRGDRDRNRDRDRDKRRRDDRDRRDGGRDRKRKDDAADGSGDAKRDRDRDGDRHRHSDRSRDKDRRDRDRRRDRDQDRDQDRDRDKSGRDRDAKQEADYSDAKAEENTSTENYGDATTKNEGIFQPEPMDTSYSYGNNGYFEGSNNDTAGYKNEGMDYQSQDGDNEQKYDKSKYQEYQAEGEGY